MLARRLQRRANNNPALGQCIVFAGLEVPALHARKVHSVQRQTAVTAYFSSEQLPLFASGLQSVRPDSNITHRLMESRTEISSPSNSNKFMERQAPVSVPITGVGIALTERASPPSAQYNNENRKKDVDSAGNMSTTVKAKVLFVRAGVGVVGGAGGEAGSDNLDVDDNTDYGDTPEKMMTDSPEGAEVEADLADMDDGHCSDTQVSSL